MAVTFNSNYKNWHKPILNPDKQKTKQGYYKLQNLDKFLGDPTKIIYRSGWESAFCRYCDLNPKIIQWSSEPIGIDYYNRIANLSECQKYNLNPNNPSNWKICKYYIDFWCKVKINDNEIEKWLIEIKPYYQTVKPIPPKEGAKLKEVKRYVTDAKNYLVNEAKWAAAKIYAEQNNAKFYIFTEKTLHKIGIL